MTADRAARLITLPDRPGPHVAESAFVAAGAVLVGNVSLAEHASVWYNAVLRAEAEPIRIGVGSNLQDNVSCHVDGGYPLIVGRDVSVGHGAVLHGCTVEDGALIGMAATVLNGAVIGAGSLVAAGCVVLEGTIVPPGSLVAGVPGKVRRELTPGEIEGIRHNAEAYLGHAALHRLAT
ncbi:gamma carbonic anhydrase family protein [Cryobacterium adonitolivorans]|uniref:Gamma carbonic anhydrase family protein n=1 Tax=Cryobacterium adonitolivorans TaxID=1259189 RepID=A0A4R8W9U6_9MICO|nr:gamma carbonic anhydrase family protein [Cryobacterium adonitolivorans]TFC04839.1 gamma carbonic anhydrase family protein [Cryobacterium adonitolivorans]